MKNISLYVDNGTFLTKLHPFTKALYIAAAVSIPLLSGRLWMFGASIGLSAVLLLCGRLFHRILPLTAFSFTILLTIFLIHGLFHQGNSTVLLELGSVRFYKEGLLYALKIGLNILNMLFSFAVFVLSTKPQELVEEMEKAGFPPRFGYMIGSVFQIIPQMAGSMNTIMDAQRSRGLETEGGLLTRAKAFLPLISPVVTSSLINTRERAAALEIRGFDSGIKKTFLQDRPVYKPDRIWRVLIIAFFAAAVIRRIYECLL